MSIKGIFKYRCRRDPGKLYNNNYLKKNLNAPRPSENYCYKYLTKDQHLPIRPCDFKGANLGVPTNCRK